MPTPTVAGSGKDQEEEVIPAIRHEDAEWKLIQENTFRRWVNNHLQKAGETINSLDSDFADGLKLIALAAVLSQKNLGKYNKRVAFRSQKLENVSLALNFFQKEEHIKIINIDSSHIVDQNKKLIMGLIWTLILHYSISMGWTQSSDDGGQSDETPKTKLLNWIRSRLPGVPITNFTSDWNDGLALGALVNALYPESVPDWQQWTPDQALDNTQRAMQEAQDKLGIAPLITPSELIHPDIDERSVMTYLSQFPASKPVPAKSVKAHGYMTGVDERPLCGFPSEFEVQLTTDGYKPKMTIQDKEGNEVHHTVSKKSPTLYNIKYTPTKVGEHKLSLALTDKGTGATEAVEGGEKIVNAQPAARLRELPQKVYVGDNVPLEIEDAGAEMPEIVIVDAAGQKHSLPLLASRDGSVYACEYVPENVGLHSVNVFQRKAHIPGSPFRLPVAKKGGYILWGRGIEPEGVRVGDKAEVHIECEDDTSPAINDGHISLAVRNADGSLLPVDALFDSDNDRLTYTYVPTKAGELQVEACTAGEHIGDSPFKVKVSPATTSQVRAFGCGLEGGVVNHPAVFTVDSHGEADGLAVSIEGPSRADISSQDKGKGQAIFSYTPTAPGIYKVNLLSRGEHIKGSPFVAQVVEPVENFQPSAARVSIPQKPFYSTGELVPIKIDSRHAGAHKVPSITVTDSALKRLPVQLDEVSPGMYACSFVPQQPGPHHVDVSLDGVALPGAPFTVPVRNPVDISKLRMFGPGIDGPIFSRLPTEFTIDAKAAGPGDVEVQLRDAHGKNVHVDVLDNKDGSFTVSYQAPSAGAYQVNVKFAGEKISPIEIQVKPQVNVAGIRVEGLENAIVTVNCEKELHVFTSDGANTRILITSPSGRVVEAIIESTADGFRVRFTPSEVGDYTIAVSYEGIPIESSPFMLHSLPDNGPGDLAEAEYVVSGSGPPRADLVSVTGPGLGPVVAQRSTHVIIDTTNAGFGDIDLFVDGPTRTPLHCVDNQDGTLTMYYVPRTAGLYYLRVMFDNEHVTGSPFQVMAVSQLLASPLISSEKEKAESPFTSLSSGSSTPHTAPCIK